MFAPYCAEGGDVQGRCRLQHWPTYWSTISRQPGPNQLLLPADRYSVAQWQPCFTPRTIMRQLGFIQYT